MEEDRPEEGLAAEDLGPAEAEDMFETDEDREVYRLIGQNPLLERVQVALKKQLTATSTRVEVKLREEEEDLKRAKQRREDLGVELYGVQQRLARLQMDLEKKHSHVAMVQEIRADSEKRMKEAEKEAKIERAKVEEQEATIKRYQADLDAMNATLIQIAKYNEQMEGEIAVTRRATYKAEEDVALQEKAKAQQDTYLDSLHEQVKKLHEDLALYQAQLVSQQQETKSAVDTLQNAGSEMEQISFEKKQLLQQWQSSLIGMTRRDEALQAQIDEMNKIKEAERSFTSSIGSVKQQIQKAQRYNETLTGVNMKLDSEAQFLRDRIAGNKEETARAEANYEMLQKSLEETEDRLAKLKESYKVLVEEEQEIRKKHQIVQQERQKLEVDIIVEHSDETTASKGAKNLRKEALEIQQKIHKKEQEMSQMENELARIKVDSLNAKSHNEELEKMLDKLVKELRDKDKLIEKYEMEIRQRNDEIEKKMYAVDRLNRKFEALTAATPEEENLGPLEATIKNMNTEKDKMEKENREKQKEWLRVQTELVDLANQQTVVEGNNHEKRSRSMIMQQRRVRLDKAIDSVKGEIKQLKQSTGSLHTDMSRLNELVAKNVSFQEKLANDYGIMEMEFIRELKELEEASIAANKRVEALRAEKEGLLSDIVECEKQILLWEKKIQLEKETKEALDPTVGVSEAQGMEKEIHRMRLRYNSLKRDQEQMIQEMERAVLKRETISIKYASRGKGGEVTKADLLKKTRRLKTELQKYSHESVEHERMIRSRLGGMEGMNRDLEEERSSYAELEDKVNALQAKINEDLYRKQQLMDQITMNKRFVDRIEKAMVKEDVFFGPEFDSRAEDDLAAAELEREKIKTVIKSLKKREDLQHLVEVLDRVDKLLV